MKSNHSRRKFLQSTAIIGAALPFTAFEKPIALRAIQDEQANEHPHGESPHTILLNGDTVTISAGILFRSVSLAVNQIKTTRLQIGGKDVLTDSSFDFKVRFQDASPNRKPAGLVLTPDQKLVWSDPQQATAKEQPVQWNELAMIDGGSLASFFTLVDKKIVSPEKGVTRLQLGLRSLKDNVLKDVSIHVYYEIYAGFPAIRKWIEIVNNSAKWMKIDRLVIDDIAIDKNFDRITALTPADRGAESAVIAYSNTELSSGLIVASEVPSALRTIDKTGATGYADEYFEWVLGPSENFVSEPVFHFAFHGKNVATISGISTALDRAVETPFKDFLRTIIGLCGSSSSVPAPIWCSYSNFLADLRDADMRQQADIAAKAGFVTFQLDEGWAGTPSPGGSEPGSAFPDFESTCSYIRSKGMQLGLWISCFRGPDSKDLAAIPDGRCLPLFTNTKRGYGMSFSSSWKDYFTNDLLFMKDKFGMTYVKIDLTNISKGDIAEGHESRTKKESLLRGLQGMLGATKKLQEKAPEVWTQVTHELYWRTPGPAADLAVLKNASAFHTSPNTYLGAGFASKKFSADWDLDPVQMRDQLIKSCYESRERFFNHRGLPLYLVEFYAAHAVNIKGSLTTQVQDRQICSWLMGAPTVFAGDLRSLTEENITHYRSRFDLLKRLQRTYEIYRYFQYSGVPTPTDTGWHWWGKLNEKGNGIVVVIRGNAGENARTINIPWVIDHRNYIVVARLSNVKLGKFEGSKLKKGIIKLELPALGQEILELAPAD